MSWRVKPTASETTQDMSEGGMEGHNIEDTHY